MLSLAVKAGETSKETYLLSLANHNDFSSLSGSLPLDERGIDDLFRILAGYATFMIPTVPKSADALIRFLLPYSFSMREDYIESWLDACFERPFEETEKVFDGILHAFGNDSFDKFLAAIKKFSVAAAKKENFSTALRYADRLVEYDPDNREHYRWRILVKAKTSDQDGLLSHIYHLEDCSDIEADRKSVV